MSILIVFGIKPWSLAEPFEIQAMKAVILFLNGVNSPRSYLSHDQ